MVQQEITEIDLLEAIHSTPARRYLSDKSIPDNIIWNILDAAIRGPSGANNQNWIWMVIKEKHIKNKIADWYLEGWNQAYGARRQSILNGTDNSDNLGRNNYLSAEYLANHIADAPVWILPILRNIANSNTARAGSSIYGAVQNLILAARAYGVGTTLTTLLSNSGHEDEAKELLGIPSEAMIMALVPMGYPSKGRWTQPRRNNVENVTFWDGWGNSQVR